MKKAHQQSPGHPDGHEKFQAEVRRCLEVLRAGGVILYPTDTVWGLGCDATNESAVQRIGEIKKRGAGLAYVVLIHSPDQLGRYVRQVPDVAWDLVEYSENPLTIVYPGGLHVARDVLGKEGTLAVRIPRHPFCQALLTRFGRALVSTSANISGEPSPRNFGDIGASILSQVDYVVNLPSEQARRGTPSAIMSLGPRGEIKILRK